jgi:UDP-N-acetylglucosamine:LPS N-acetylglucosamine transferase
MIVQRALSAELLSMTVQRLLDDPQLLADRSRAVLKRARPRAADEIARHVLELANQSTSS